MAALILHNIIIITTQAIVVVTPLNLLCLGVMPVIVQYHTIPYTILHTVQYHTIPYHTIQCQPLYNMIPFHNMYQTNTKYRIPVMLVIELPLPTNAYPRCLIVIIVEAKIDKKNHFLRHYSFLLLLDQLLFNDCHKSIFSGLGRK